MNDPSHVTAQTGTNPSHDPEFLNLSTMSMGLTWLTFCGSLVYSLYILFDGRKSAFGRFLGTDAALRRPVGAARRALEFGHFSTTMAPIPKGLESLSPGLRLAAP